MILKDIQKNFSYLGQQLIKTNALYSHNINRGKLKGSDKVWIRKEIQAPAIAKIELIAQEFFRLIIPHQPETRLLIDSSNVHYILSEEVLDYKELPQEESQLFINGTYSGLGQALIVSMFLQEIDLKNGNIGLDYKKRVIKIDGDWSFASQREDFEEKIYSITPTTIESLPLPVDFYAFNWLDYICANIKRDDSYIVDSQLKNSPFFRREVNQAILKICLIPHGFLEKFIDAGMPAGGDRFLSLMKERQELLIKSILKNESFIAYLETDDAIKDLDELIQQMTTFTLNEEKVIFSKEDLHQKTHEKFILLKDRISPAENKSISDEIYIQEVLSQKIDDENDFSSPTSLENHDLIDHYSPIAIEQNKEYDKKNEELLIEISKCSIGKDDKYITEYVNNKTKVIFKSISFFEKKELNKELKKTLESVRSEEIEAVKKSINHYRDTANFFTRLKLKKAKNIEIALYNTPLNQRKNIISQNGPANAVQEALASHRSLGFGGRVYKNKYNEINLKRSANTFKKLKQKFTPH